MNMPGPGCNPMPQDLLMLLADRRIHLSVQAGRLGFRAPSGAVDGRVRELLFPYRDDLLQALSGLKDPVLLCPLSFNQQSLFFLNLLEPQSAAYNLAFTMELLPAADATVLLGALARLVNRHEQLRTTYGHVRLGEELLPVQFVHASLSPVLEAVDGRSWTDAEATDKVREFYRRPFDLKQGAPLRAALFDRGPERSIFMVVVHHIAADAWSLGVIRRDLEQACVGQLTHGTVSSGGEYTDFTLAQRRALAEAGGAVHLDYWIAQYRQPALPLEIAEASRRPRVRRSFGATRRFRIEQDLRQAIEDAARGQGMTAFALLLAVFQWQLMERSGGRDVVVGIPTLGRSDRRYEHTVGYFVNPIPVRCMRSDPCSFREHAGTTAQELRDALEHRDAPFAAVVERLGGGRDTSRTPIFQAMFNLLSRRTMGNALDLLFPAEGSREFDLAGRKATAWGLDQQEGQFDLTLELVDQCDHVQGLWKYCSDLFTSAEAEAMAAGYVEKLQQALAAPDRSLFDAAGREVRPVEQEPETIAVAATFTAEMLKEFYEFWSERLTCRTQIHFAQFNQVFQALLDPSSVLRTNRRGYNVVLIRPEDFVADRGAGGPASAETAAKVLDELREAVAAAAGSMAVPLCLVLCPPSPAGRAIAERCEAELRAFLQAVRAVPGVTVLTHDDISSSYPVTDYHEPLGEELGRIPYTRSYFAALAAATMRTMHARNRQPVKALVLDCDGTLWDGVAAEDGPTGVTVGPQQRRFQEFLLELHRAGVILGLCSKNREADVWAVFDRHPDMLLRRGHVGFWRINWEPKSQNIRALREEMNIGLDAIAFLDDNPVERAEVRAQCPAVVCPELPEAWEDRADWIRHLWLLDQGARTEEDGKRQEQYRMDHLRDDLRQQAGSFREFLERLGLEVRLQPATAGDHERLAQLSVRTNQFTTTVQRYTVQEIAAYGAVSGRSAHTARVSDRFGDYGLVGGMLIRADGGTLHIDNLFLSCRALGRGVEHRIAAYLGAAARQADCQSVAFPVLSTDRNEPARNFLARLGRLLDGTVNEQGTLLVSAERLVNAPYDEILIPTGDGAASPTELSVRAGGADTADRERFFGIADELRTVDAILLSVDRMARDGRRRKDRTDGSGMVIAPASHTEQLIADIWKRVLSIDAVSTQSNFFDLGGTSLLMARIAIELGRDHGREVTLVDLFQYPTIADLARHLDGAGPAGDRAGRAEMNALRQRDALRRNLSPAFQRLKESRG